MGSTSRKKSRDRRKKKIKALKNKSILKSCDKPSASGAESPTSTVWENIVLHYLSKLKNAWSSRTQNQHPTPGVRQSADVRFKHSGATLAKAKFAAKGRATPTPDKYSSNNRLALKKNRSKSQPSVASLGSESARVARKKAMNIVTNALEYGRSKGIISKNGKFYWLRYEKGDVGEFPCKDCKSCAYLNKKTHKCSKDKSMDTTSGLSIYDAFSNDKPTHDKNKYPSRRHNNDKDDYLHVDCDCKRCRTDRKHYK